MSIFDRFPYSSMHEINLDWIIKEVKKVVSEAEAAKLTAEQTRAYVDEYFLHLDVSEEVKAAIEQMIEDGSLQELVRAALDELTLQAESMRADITSLEKKTSYFGYHVKYDANNYLDVADLNAAIANGFNQFIFPAGVRLFVTDSILLNNAYDLSFWGNHCDLVCYRDIPIFKGELCQKIYINDFSMRKPVGTHYHIDLDGAVTVTISGCYLYGLDSGSGNAGIKICESDVPHNGFVLTIKNNILSRGKIYTSSGDSHIVNNVVWANDMDGYAITLAAASLYCYENQVVGGHSGAIAINGNYVFVCNNYIDGSYEGIATGDGIVINRGLGLVSGNHIYNQSGAGIVLNETNLNVCNNIFNDNGKGAGRGDIVFLLPQYDYYGIIKNNTFHNNRTHENSFHPIYQPNSSVAFRFYIDGNLIDRASTGYTITGNTKLNGMLIASSSAEFGKNSAGHGGIGWI